MEKKYNSLSLESYHLIVPSLDVAIDLFSNGLNLQMLKQTEKSITFMLNDKTKLFCWLKPSHPISYWTNKVNCFASTEVIKNLAKYLEPKSDIYDVRLTKLELDYEKSSLELNITTKGPVVTSVHLSDFELQ